ncbi:MAG: nucleotide-binding protein [bacterium]
MIFIGSSSEASRYAKQICHYINEHFGEGTALFWQDAFDEGMLTFESIEDALESCTGAIVLVHPDDKAIVRDKTVLLTRQNVILEWGLFVGRLGKRRAIIVEFEGVTLPNDLLGLTTLRIPRTYNASAIVENVANQFSEEYTLLPEHFRRISSFCNKFRLPRNQKKFSFVSHAFSGNWYVSLKFDRWRNIVLADNDEISVRGKVFVDIPLNESSGKGVVWGNLIVHIQVASDLKHRGMKESVVNELVSSGYRFVKASFRVVDEIDDIHIRNGKLILSTTAFSRERIDGDNIDCLKGEDGFSQKLDGHAKYTWVLTETTEKNILRGVYNESSGRSRGELTFTRLNIDSINLIE